MWYVYIIYSETIDSYYIGYTANIPRRMERHNQGWGRFTRSGIPWKLVYFEPYWTKQEAVQREREIKSKKSRRYIEQLILGKW